MKEMILIKTGEIVLKGLNRHIFERMLMDNIRKAIEGIGQFSMRIAQSTIYVEPASAADFDAMMEAIGKVFGIAAITRAGVMPKDIDKIMEMAPAYLKDEMGQYKTFKVESKRSDKKFPLKSPQISEMVGGAIYEAFDHLEVDVQNPDVVVRVEIRDTDAYVYAGRIQGAGGMPVGSNGRAALLLSGGIDSPVAGYMIAKRGVALDAIHFFSPPYTGEKAKEKVLELARIVGRYTGGMRVFVVPFTEQQLAIRDNCPEEHLTLIMRRMMMMTAEKIAARHQCRALVTGESLGQVASQTMWALQVTDVATDMVVLRPCIGLDKEEIVQIARKIGSFETSILPYEDCCTVFTPRHPTTKPQLDKILKSEAVLDMEALVAKAVEETYVVEV